MGTAQTPGEWVRTGRQNMFTLPCDARRSRANPSAERSAPWPNFEQRSSGRPWANSMLDFLKGEPRWQTPQACSRLCPCLRRGEGADVGGALSPRSACAFPLVLRHLSGRAALERRLRSVRVAPECGPVPVRLPGRRACCAEFRTFDCHRLRGRGFRARHAEGERHDLRCEAALCRPHGSVGPLQRVAAASKQMRGDQSRQRLIMRRRIAHTLRPQALRDAVCGDSWP